MRAGDLVNFFTTSWVFEGSIARYQNPGVVLTGSHGVYTVLWADGKITKEHHCYLREGEIKNESR